ncbi:hypothetical protein [Acidomonas methanolica]|uniref:Cytochrome c class I n=1 Tax=Acidomonas methanolica NBRC 104435 TaxID=1231351 RepID=A0A023D1X1_ACIMT|nr:hypothetical protein [Acidomonas methanolica]MBU2654961.1 hypothetical protein [Acidomonas methanolica]TCS26312.1 hypothetical protein EDC31_11547 [Acidomonas methanolica]GAJ27806.1 cytochrome c class I [Acidomonas methanolica NBRC 104435]GBQ50807.1 hypothetical protein AA0498_1305 [Acidomonas methanolica]GEK99157.1 hypothetical protein AME01nite_16560 [Acidomonas methanolica NBRC 104435]
MRNRTRLHALLGVVAVAGVLVTPTPDVRAAIPPGEATHWASARTGYLLGCGGCHGEHGHSSPAIVPDLTGQIGYFLCTPEGRAYLVRLPNVAFAHLPSDQLAALVNYMVFNLGGSSAPKDARPYDAAEVDRLRREPFRMTDFIAYRQKVVAGVVRACPQAAHFSSFAPDDPYVMTLKH